MITEQQVLLAIEEALDLERGSLIAESSTENVENWDSLGQISILTALDQMFDGKIAEIHDMAEAESIEKILSLLKSNSLI